MDAFTSSHRLRDFELELFSLLEESVVEALDSDFPLDRPVFAGKLEENIYEELCQRWSYYAASRAGDVRLARDAP